MHGEHDTDHKPQTYRCVTFESPREASPSSALGWRYTSWPTTSPAGRRSSVWKNWWRLPITFYDVSSSSSSPELALANPIQLRPGTTAPPAFTLLTTPTAVCPSTELPDCLADLRQAGHKTPSQHRHTHHSYQFIEVNPDLPVTLTSQPCVDNRRTPLRWIWAKGLNLMCCPWCATIKSFPTRTVRSQNS